MRFFGSISGEAAYCSICRIREIYPEATMVSRVHMSLEEVSLPGVLGKSYGAYVELDKHSRNLACMMRKNSVLAGPRLEVSRSAVGAGNANMS